MNRVPATNWAGSFHYGFRDGLFPASLEQVSEAVSGARSVKVLGSRHSFNGIVDGTLAMMLTDLPADPVLETGGTQVSIGAHATYGELALFLARHRLAIHNLASLPHISIAGAIATATHGSGDRLGNLATAVAALELVAGDGSIVRAKRGDPDFAGMVVHLGALGVVTRVTLDVQPEFEVAQTIYEGLSWANLLDHFDEITSAGYSVSVFTQWGDQAGSVWIKQAVSSGASPAGDGPAEFYGAKRATLKRHPIIGLDAENVTEQFGVAGRWSDRLPHFRMGFTPSNGEEIQSELHVPRRHAKAAIEALLSIAEKFRPLLQTGELRTVAADDLWLSPQYGRDTLSFHFTWVRDQAAVDAATAEIEAALAPYEALPHWGKVFAGRGLGARYAKFPDFARLRERLDPSGKFSNPWLEEKVFGSNAT